ncbi:MAG: 1,4-alpha-glucan branching protein GlgB [Flavobacteriales bacterium]|nr:1,4-alpha-glucan branching protein GlgB [Flavobacteriales bacterium]
MDSDVQSFSLFNDGDVQSFREGSHYALHHKFGSTPMEVNGTAGTYFAVWVPNADEVVVMGDFNEWSRDRHKLNVRWDSSGIWEGFIPAANPGHAYKYLIRANQREELEKGDPFARRWEMPPKTASVIHRSEYTWNDDAWLKARADKKVLQEPMSVYEVHLGSWRRNADGYSLSYRELIDALVPYVVELGYTHVEFMPVMEHPFFGSWGYQITGYFAPTARFGTPEDLKALIDAFHAAGIGVILDWAPSHYPGDAHGLYRFDGTHLYEHADPRKGFHPDWNSYIFNYGRNEVLAFLVSNARYWFEEFHADGLRVDAVASMLYLDYSRNEGEWIPNEHGGRENLEAIHFMKQMNEVVYRDFPGAQTIAEESTSFPGVTQPTYLGGLGFGKKWMMGWMNDSLEYFKKDPLYRQYHHNEISFSLTYMFSEKFMLPLSHDEVVHGKGSLLERMPGDEWQRFAHLRLLFGYMMGHPGSKLSFMGNEIAQPFEWKHDEQLRWDLLKYEPHKGQYEMIKVLNELYKSEPALYERTYEQKGFEWIDHSDHVNGTLVWIRHGFDPKDDLVIVANFTPVARESFRIGIPSDGRWSEVLNTDDRRFYGSGFINGEALETNSSGWHGRPYSLDLKVPPLGVTFLKKSNA